VAGHVPAQWQSRGDRQGLTAEDRHRPGMRRPYGWSTPRCGDWVLLEVGPMHPRATGSGIPDPPVGLAQVRFAEADGNSPRRPGSRCRRR
jgi:hypothetical protein